MKSLDNYKRLKRLVLLVSVMFVNNIYSQTYVTWNNQPPEANTITGTYGAGTLVTVTTQGGGGNIGLESPASNTNNLVTTVAANTFDTNGPGNSQNSQTLLITFNPPVYITQYNMSDIDRGGTWDDSFNFVGVTFANNTSTTSNTNLNGAVVTNDPFNSGGFASWFCSSQPIQTFSLNYFGNNANLVHEFLGYSIEVLIPPTIDDICLDDTTTNLPTTIGNNISGTWNPEIINTSAIGTTTYTFTPDNGQAIQCPITMDVTIVDCCLPDLTSNIIISTMVQEERDIWIRSTDNITFSDGILGNGVVYHAGDFIELNPEDNLGNLGFEAVFGSQFSAYIEGCSGNYVYRLGETEMDTSKDVPRPKNSSRIINKPSYFDIILDDFGENIKIPITDYELEYVELFSIQGKLLYSGAMDKNKVTIIPVEAFDSGVYIVKVTSAHGKAFSEKFIKK